MKDGSRDERPTKGERREEKQRNARKMRVAGRSVFLLQELAGRPARRRKVRRATAR